MFLHEWIKERLSEQDKIYHKYYFNYFHNLDITKS